MELKDVKKAIIDFLKRKGPSLTVHIAKYIRLDSLFTGAYLSELYSEKEIKISHMKVGSSPLYLLAGQEAQLEKFMDYLPEKEKQAVILLKKEGLLKDEQQAPAIRVALRNLPDFAIPFRINNKILWKYISMNDEMIKERIFRAQKPKKERTVMQKEEAKQIIKKPAIEKIKPNLIQKQETLPKIEEKKKEVEKPEKIKKVPGRPEFVLKIIESLKSNNIPVLEEVNCKKKEYSAIIQVNSELGPIKFLLQAKDKKRVSIIDLISLIREAKSRDMLALFLSPGELNKKSQDYALENDSILKVKKLRI